ncbi:glycoside hydrolase family 3 N-terminal domain-containing protein [Spirochaetota bacterium]
MFLFVCVLVLASCARTGIPGADPNPGTLPDDGMAATLAKAHVLMAMMSDDELVGQVMMTGVHGTSEPSTTSQAILVALKPGAVILFGYNIEPEPRLLASLSDGIRGAASVAGMPPFIAIDHEGGSVYRFKAGLTRLPSASIMGAAGEAAAQAAGDASGYELMALGVTMNMAPVVEASSETNQAFLSDRAWSNHPERAGRLAAVFLSACQAQGLAAVAKHYPGNAASDPHASLPVLDISQTELEELYEEPFRQAIAQGVSALMLSHAIVPVLDPGLPVSLSPKAIDRIKGKLGFKGIVMTDDLHMAALSGLGDSAANALVALSSGADMLMISDERLALELHASLLGALRDGRLNRARLEDAVTRIMTQKLRFGLDADTDDERDSMLDALEDRVAEHRAALARALGAPPRAP